MKHGTVPPSNGILGEDNMFDPTQTQPLSWRMHQGKAMPWEDVPVDPPNRQAPTFDDSPPERLSDRGYRLRARLGSGRLGSVYEAQDELSRISGSQHLVAVLLIDSRIASRPGFDAEFERGAAELKSVTHPNIVRLLEYGRDHGRHYLVNELLESASLRFVLNDVGTLPAAESTAVLRAIGDALEYLHAKGIVHGNLSPENVLVTFGYEVKLLDVVPRGWLENPDDALGIPARAKPTGIYLSSALAKTEANLNGFDEAIVLNQDGHISEGSAENFFVVRGGVAATLVGGRVVYRNAASDVALTMEAAGADASAKGSR